MELERSVGGDILDWRVSHIKILISYVFAKYC